MPDRPTSPSSLPLGVSLRQRFAALSTESEIAAVVRQERESLLSEIARHDFATRNAGGDWMHRHAELIDACLRRLLSLAGERGEQPAKTGIAILATGGYGQRTLAPHSDLDLSFLSARDDDSTSGLVLRHLFNMVMDTLAGGASGAKYKVGYGYRTLPDVESLPPQGVLPYDHQTQTALLDARLVAGDSVLFARFDRSLLSHLQIADFLFRKHAEWMRRREKFGASPLLSEPNLKEGAGGLRDLQTAAWMARVRFGKHPASIGSGELWRDMARRKVITEFEQTALLEDRDFLLSVRCSLHANAGERKDFFGRARQEAVANAMGTDLETFLHRYYAGSERLAQVSEKIITRCLESPIPLPTPGLAVARRQVTVSEPDKLDAESTWGVRAVAYCQTYNLVLAPATEEAIARAATKPDGGAIPGAEPVREMLTQSGDIAASVRRMHRTGLLAVYLPELAACMTTPAHDPAHRFTVGEHTLRVLENIVSLQPRETASVGYHAPSVPPASSEAAALRELLQSLDSPLPLYIAALLHDIGKQTRTLQDGTPAPHERTGAEMAPAICRRLGLSDAETDTVTALVRQHLLMAQVARLRDLNLPETVRQFADSIGTLERLKMLYLLTWADTNAVAPGVWTPLQAGQVGELFGRAYEYLEGRSDPGATVAPAASQEERDRAVRDRLRRQLAREAELALPREERGTGQEERGEAARAHSETMPSAYLLATPLPVMAKHVHMVTRLLETGGRPVVDLHTTAPDADTTDLIVVALDDPAPGLLAKITGVLLAFDVRVYSVQAFTRTEPNGERIVLDTLSVNYHDKPLPPLKRADVAEALTQVLGGELPLSDLLKKRGRESAATAPLRAGVKVLMTDETVGQNLTLLDLAAPNEISIVYRLCACLTALGTNIHSARISLFGGNARCAFYVAATHGRAVAAELLQRGIENAFPQPD
ncbi:MAG: HD domain-containing protein [Armatimonadetes bacterium]|nr:HD domain-containing protein [Armatimonadota bacterium]